MVLILCINVKIVTVDSARINCQVLKQIKHKIQRGPHKTDILKFKLRRGMHYANFLS